MIEQLWILLQHICNGLLYGAIYALITAGLTMIFGILEVVNFAHGEFYMLGAYAMAVMLMFTGNYIAAVIFSLGFMVLIGMFAERIAVQPLIGKGKGGIPPLIATLSLSLILQYGVLYIFSAKPIFLYAGLVPVVLKLGEVYIPAQRLLVLMVAVVAFLLLNIFLTRTKTGKAMRALSQNRELAMVVGIKPEKIYLVTFMIGATMAGMAGALVGPIFSINPRMGVVPAFKAFCITVAGGFGNVKGSIYASFLVGITESLAAGYISGTWKDIFAFAILIFVLLFKPEGLFGKRVGIW